MERSARRERSAQGAAWAVWAVFLTIICVVVAIAPEKRSVTGIYRTAAVHFRAGKNLYAPSPYDFLYLPSGAVLYTPFTWPPLPIGEVLYRLMIGGLYATAIWRLAYHLRGDRSGSYFLVLTLLVLPVAAASLRNGQMNAILAAGFIHGVLSIIQKRWWWAAAALGLALAAKPTAIVMVLLTAALFPPLRGPLVVAVLAGFLLPFVHPAPGYVAQQYQSGLVKMLEAAGPGVGSYDELRGLLYGLGVRVPHTVLVTLRLLAALAVLALGWLALRRYDRARAVLFVLGLGTAYLMVFNPRTEANSYLIVAPAMLIFAAWEHEWRRYEWAILLAAFCVALALVNVIAGSPFPVPRPLMTLVFGVYLTVLVLRPHAAPEPAPPRPPPNAR